MKEAVILLLALLLAAYNGQFLSGASRSWHATGFIMRALLLVFIWPDVTMMLVYTWLAWIAYDAIINLYRRLPWHYTGTTSWIETHIPTAWLWFLKIALTFTTVAFILVNWFGI
jgi:hypothetical protein